MADAAIVLPACLNGATVVLPVAGQQAVAVIEPCPVADRAQDGGSGGIPSAGVVDSQSVKTTKSGGPQGYDAGKKVKGRKRHILTDTDGNLVHAVVHTADI